MKKTLMALCLCTVLLLSAVSCGESAQTANNNTEVVTAGGEVVTEAPVTEAVTEVVTEAPKRDKISYIELSSGEGNRNPVSLMQSGTSVGVRFTANGFVESATIACPSWSDNVGSLTMKVYAWNTDYDTTVAGDPVASETFEDYDDNAELTMTMSSDSAKGLPAGEYLLWLGDGVDANKSGVGYWSYDYPADEENVIEIYKSGKLTTNMGPDGSITIVTPAE